MPPRETRWFRGQLRRREAGVVEFEALVEAVISGATWLVQGEHDDEEARKIYYLLLGHRRVADAQQWAKYVQAVRDSEAFQHAWLSHEAGAR